MADIEGEDFNLDDLEPLGEEPATDELAEQPAADDDELTSIPVEPQEEQAVADEPAEAAKKAPRALPPHLELACFGGAGAVLLILALFGLLFYSTAIFVIAVALVPYGIWRTRQTANAYTVLLGITLVAVLTAVYSLWLELGRYHFDVKARSAKQQVGVSAPAEAQFLADISRTEVGSSES